MTTLEMRDKHRCEVAEEPKRQERITTPGHILIKIPISCVVANKGNISLDRRQSTVIGTGSFGRLATAQSTRAVMLEAIWK